MRAEYAREGLDESAAGVDPVRLFGWWLDDVVRAGIHEPNAMALATATTDGSPSNRIVLLKGMDESGMTFFTNYDSRKGVELDSNPQAAAVMLWHPLQRQVRVEGHVTRIGPEDSEAYFRLRPRLAQLGAVASPQSHVIAGRGELEARVSAAEKASADGQVARPEHWGGYRLGLVTIEFWQGRENRLHDRLRFTREGASWRRERLAP